MILQKRLKALKLFVGYSICLKMLSKATYKGMYLAFRILIWFKTGPFDWNYERKKLTISKKWHVRFGFYLTTSFVIFHFSFALFRSIQSVLFLNAPPAMFLLQLAVVGQAGLTISCQVNTFLYSRDTANFVTTFLEMEQGFTSK